ncbi:hypothetical protein NicSoilC12_13900 [Arthrobacter sp. NicSoilC12]|nr:hypothetical protein NicSoilC12_13900 [Arthrobacter sp. NicSoilC12]
MVFEDAPAGIAAGIAAGVRTVAVGPNAGELPDGVLHIPDYSGGGRDHARHRRRPAHPVLHFLTPTF